MFPKIKPDVLVPSFIDRSSLRLLDLNIYLFLQISLLSNYLVMVNLTTT